MAYDTVQMTKPEDPPAQLELVYEFFSQLVDFTSERYGVGSELAQWALSVKDDLEKADPSVLSGFVKR